METPGFPHWTHVPESESDWFETLLNLARYLRGPDGCPWDRAQTSADFARYMKGEAEELVEAVESGDAAHAQEEFGDTLFTLLAVAAAAESEGRMDVREALRAAHEKMIRRHEHVFGDERAETPEDAIRIWEKVKRRERETKNT
jgi:uncharacterized protein YabN with tetrapyrrole methylase and pyrophosphatase domain